MALSLDGTTGISASGNITGNNIIVTNSLTVGSFSPASVSTSGNVTGGNIVTVGLISASGSLTAGSATINGDLTVTGNASLTGNIVADRIVNGTTEVAIQTTNGNANVTVGGVSNVVVFTSTGVVVTGITSVSGNVTGGNILTGGLASVTGNISGGNITVTGDATAQNFNTLSDAVIKTNIAPLVDPQSIIDSLFGVEYDWKNGQGRSYGFVAQDVEKVLPEAVKTQNGLKSVNYTMIIPFLVETIKQLRTEVQDLKQKINKL